MKKQNILILIPLLLASCTSYSASAFIEETKDAFSTMKKETMLATYKANPSGHVLNFDQFLFSENDVKELPTLLEEENGYDFGSSYALHVPLRITSESYYPSSGNDDSKYSYSIFQYLFNFSGDNQHHLSYKKEKDNHILYVENISKECRIGYVKTDQNLFTNKDIRLYARFDLYATYDSDGFLKEELIKTVSATEEKNNNTVYYHVSYQYQ